MHLTNNVQTFLDGNDHRGKANLQEINKVNNMKTRKVHVDRNKLHPGKEWRLYSQYFRQ